VCHIEATMPLFWGGRVTEVPLEGGAGGGLPNVCFWWWANQSDSFKTNNEHLNPCGPSWSQLVGAGSRQTPTQPCLQITKFSHPNRYIYILRKFIELEWDYLFSFLGPICQWPITKILEASGIQLKYKLIYLRNTCLFIII